MYNWTITDGDIYVSKNGNDTIGDGSMNNPYASLNKGFIELGETKKIVIGTGTWKESVSTFPKSFYMIGDGEVIFNGYNSNRFNMIINVGTLIDVNITIKNIKFKEYYTYTGFIWWTFSENSRINIISCSTEYRGIINYTNAVMNNIYDNTIKYKNTTFYRFDSANNTIKGTFTNCTIIGPTLNSIGGQLYNSILTDYTFTNGTYASFCCLYNFSPTIIYGINNIKGLNPKFNNTNIGDYTLQPDSPCLFAGKNNTHIGAFGLGYNVNANSTEFTEEGGAIFSQSNVGSGTENDIVKTSQTINGVTTRYFILKTGHTEGTVESEWIDFQTLTEINSVKLFANFIYDEDGIATDRVDIDNNDTGQYPNQYDFELKVALDDTEKTTATWQEVIWNKELSNISARFVKLKIYMKE